MPIVKKAVKIPGQAGVFKDPDSGKTLIAIGEAQADAFIAMGWTRIGDVPEEDSSNSAADAEAENEQAKLAARTAAEAEAAAIKTGAEAEAEAIKKQAAADAEAEAKKVLADAQAEAEKIREEAEIKGLSSLPLAQLKTLAKQEDVKIDADASAQVIVGAIVSARNEKKGK